jgi:hypothetical protein
MFAYKLSLIFMRALLYILVQLTYFSPHHDMTMIRHKIHGNLRIKYSPNEKIGENECF